MNLKYIELIQCRYSKHFNIILNWVKSNFIIKIIDIKKADTRYSRQHGIKMSVVYTYG